MFNKLINENHLRKFSLHKNFSKTYLFILQATGDQAENRKLSKKKGLFLVLIERHPIPFFVGSWWVSDGSGATC